MRKTKPLRDQPEIAYPQRNAVVACDASRRRFLRQLVAGTGMCVAGLPRLGHGQSLPIEFSKLDRHVPSPDTSEIAQALADDSLGAEFAAAGEMGAEDSDDSGFPTPADSAAEPPVALVEENRALWVEPGYLVLLRWLRPSDVETPVAALEGAADAVQRFLETRVTSVDQIHNLDQLHPLEYELIELLRPLVAPAEISVLHLDHDCRVVCSVLNPGRSYPEIYELVGDIAEPGWQ